MIYFQWTVFTLAFWQLISRFARNVITCTLFLVALFAKMGVAPTEPLSY